MSEKLFFLEMFYEIDTMNILIMSIDKLDLSHAISLTIPLVLFLCHSFMKYIAISLYLIVKYSASPLSNQSICWSKTSRLPMTRWRGPATRPGDQARLRPLTVSDLPGLGGNSLSP